MHGRNSRQFLGEHIAAKCGSEIDSGGCRCSKMDLLGPPSDAKTALWVHFEGLFSSLGLMLQSSDVPEPLQWALGVNFYDFGVLAFTILGSILELWE